MCFENHTNQNYSTKHFLNFVASNYFTIQDPVLYDQKTSRAAGGLDRTLFQMSKTSKNEIDRLKCMGYTTLYTPINPSFVPPISHN